MSQTDTRAGQSAWDAHVYHLLTASAVLLIATGTAVYRLLEDWSWVDSLYFSVVAVTTVGFGDLSPSRDVSKLFTVAYLVVGVSLITTYLNVRLKSKTAHRLIDTDPPAAEPRR